MKNTAGPIWALVILSTFFWGSNFNAAAILAHTVTPLTAAAERFALALGVFWLMRLWAGKSESILTMRDYWVIGALGIIGVFGFNYAFFTALHTTTALNAALIMSLTPLVSIGLSIIILKATVGIHQYIGMLSALIGVCLVITGGQWHLTQVAVGDFWMLFACAAWSLFNVCSKRFAGHIPPLQYSRWTVSIGATALIIAAFGIETPIASVIHLDLRSHALLIYMGICGTVLAYIYWLKGVYFFGPEKSAVAFNLVPVFTLLVNVLLGQYPTGNQLMGMVLVFGGILLSVRGEQLNVRAWVNNLKRKN